MDISLYSVYNRINLTKYSSFDVVCLEPSRVLLLILLFKYLSLSLNLKNFSFQILGGQDSAGLIIIKKSTIQTI